MGKAICKKGTLVVPARAELFRVQGYGHDDIGLVERRRIGKQRAIPYSHFCTDFGTITVFKLVDNPFYTRWFTEIPKGCHGLEANPAPQLASTAILLVLMRMGIGEMVPTAGTDQFFAAHQRRIASCAGLCKEEGG